MALLCECGRGIHQEAEPTVCMCGAPISAAATLPDDVLSIAQQAQESYWATLLLLETAIGRAVPDGVDLAHFRTAQELIDHIDEAPASLEPDETPSVSVSKDSLLTAAIALPPVREINAAIRLGTRACYGVDTKSKKFRIFAYRKPRGLAGARGRDGMGRWRTVVTVEIV